MTVLLAVDLAALAAVRASASLAHTGRERIDLFGGDDGELRVVERREHLARLDALLGRRALLSALRGALTDPVRADLAALDAERRPLGRVARDLGRYRRSSTSLAMLRAACARRAKRAAEQARALDRGERLAFDASDLHLDALPAIRDDATRARALWDVLVQLRALRRDPGIVDARADGHDDNSQGRLTTNALLMVIEARTLAERAPASAREAALVELVCTNAPHQRPNAIYRASQLSLALLGAHDRGPFGRAFLPVYHAVHTLYSADTPKIVERFARRALALGFDDDDALAQVAGALDAARSAGGRARREGRAFLSHHAPALAAFDDDERLLAIDRLLALVACVAPVTGTHDDLLRERGFAGPGADAVALFVEACARAEPATALAHALSARRALRRYARGAGSWRMRAWSLDAALERAAAQQIIEVARSRDPHAVRTALPLARAHAARGALGRALGLRLPADASGSLVRLQLAADALRAALDARARAIHFAGVRVLLDPRCADRLLKESALHALAVLCDAAGARPPARASRSGVPVRVIAAPTTRVFARQRDARRGGRVGEDELAIVSAPRGAVQWPRARAYLVDERHAPPGLSHAVLYARERGAGVLACLDVTRVARMRGPIALDGAVLRRAPVNEPAPPSRLERLRAAPVDLDGDPAPRSLRALARMTVAARRAWAGEKAVALAELFHAVPRHALDGTVLGYPTVTHWLRDAGLLNAWRAGTIEGRAAARRLSRHLEESGACARLGAGGPWIVRSAFSCEDRPGAGFAGVFASVAGVCGARAMARAIARVVCSAWSAGAKAALASRGLSPRDVHASVVVQRDVSLSRPLISGVALSRGRDGAYGAITVQAVNGGGGGVRARWAEEAVVSPVEHVVTRAGARPILDERRARVLAPAVLAIERRCFEVLEPGAGHAVDVEWLWGPRGLIIVQARAIAR